ncbi:hypothetical protein EYC80_010364 [Monilinia laxa]|uniref:Uncharacterized protein n=1 Tax=Monilinia laxa TaxID=61186 RepID=A0A5N6JP61_MONLA|nr:hypothetical protein EYC80_010364 [Monilinia laxa]
MTCFRVTRASQDQQLPLAVGLKNNTVQLVDSRGKLWSVAKYVICEDGRGSTARSREQLCEEYLECFRDRINAFNISTVADYEKVSWPHYVELIWLHGACQAVRIYRPELYAQFHSRDNKDYPQFNPEMDSVDATSMFRPHTLKFGEHAFLTAKYPWTILVAPAEDINNMDCFCPIAPFQDVPAGAQQFQGMPMQYHSHSNRSSIDQNTQLQVQSYAAIQFQSVPQLPEFKHAKTVYPTPEGSQHSKTTSGSYDSGIKKFPRLSQEKKLLDIQDAIESAQHDDNACLPVGSSSQVLDHMNCAVKLKLNEDITDKEVLDTVHAGAIYSMRRVPVENQMSVVEIVFMTHQGAQKYVDMTRRCEDILIRNQRIVAVWSNNRVELDENRRVSRVIKVTGPIRGPNLTRCIYLVKQCCWVDIIHQQAVIADKNREIVIEFGSYAGQAEVVYATLLSNHEFAGHKIEFMRDPCDVPEED